ncbi:phage head morphogenesis protein [Providencia rettgeri]|uniref:minor capsid protein n=1 Tax=Providencia TaxID=586 RepID=UPI001C8373EE|nr:minor capsid protein [Providencia rettgeri]MBX6968840.1 phage head morphogenesis protein [Providencia rettgeri]MBX6977506.1 phage head morphogenesis protein [Providencia rettgeri]MBX6994574.1 phage head morphogenesis protein [Providencia rettgeri]MBX6997303.1 phage head morphogenesis protein [Providencia rettgeri]MBX7017417.1 phage head morphogenesis protein [Providencia rettgeri]
MQSQLMLDNSMMIQILLERLKAGIVDSEEMQRELRAAVAKALANFSGQITSRSKLNAIITELKRELSPALTNYSEYLLQSVIDIGVESSQLEVDSLSQIVTNEVSKPSADKVEKSILNVPLILTAWGGSLFLKKFISSWVNSSVQQVENQAVLAMAAQSNIQTLQATINGAAIDRSQVTTSTISRITYNYRTIANTAIQHAHTCAAQEFYKENDDLIKEEEFSAILDNKTSSTCRALSGNRYPVGVGPMPPLHPNCRSQRLPILNDSFADLIITRPVGRSEWGEENYYEWLTRQPAKRQDLILGPTRGKLFRDGGLSPERFAQLQLHKNFKPMTLKDMQKLAPEAFERAGIELK